MASERKEHDVGPMRRPSVKSSSEHTRSEPGTYHDDESLADTSHYGDGGSLDKRIGKVLRGTLCICVGKEDAGRKVLSKNLKEKAKDVIRKERGVNRDEVVAFTVEDYVPGYGLTFKSKNANVPIAKTDVFVDGRYLPQIIFQEKFEEFVSCMRCLGAKSIAAEAGNQANRLENAGPDEDGSFTAWVQQLNQPIVFEALENELPSAPMRTHSQIFPFFQNEAEWKDTLQRRITEWIERASVSVSYAQIPRLTSHTAQKLDKLEINYGTLAESVVVVHQVFNVQFFPLVDYTKAIHARLCKEWGVSEVIAFFVVTCGSDAGGFYVKDAGSIMCTQPPLTVQVLLDPRQFNKETARHIYKVKRPEHIQSLLEARDKLTQPMEHELRHNIEECALSQQTRIIYKQVCYMFMDAYVKQLYAHSLSPKDDLVKRYKKKAEKESGQTADIRVRCVCLGETGVGKTSLCEAFTAHTAVTSPGRPAGQAATLEVHIDVATINAKLEISDPELSRDETVTTALKASEPQVVFLVYDITNRDTFESVQTWHDLIATAGVHSVLVLVANKCETEGRVVTLHEGLGLAETLGMMFFEVSATEYRLVEQAFTLAASTAVQRYLDALLKKRKRNNERETAPLTSPHVEQTTKQDGCSCCAIS